MNPNITVIKRSPHGEALVSYPGALLQCDRTRIVLEARFNRPDTTLVDTTLHPGDRFVETFYTDRWYNVFEIHDREDDRLKGWYCNIGRPAHFEADDRLSYIDLALDLWVSPAGRQTVLDEVEFAELGLDQQTRRQALAALSDLQREFLEKFNPGP